MHITVFWFLIHYYWNISFYYFAGNLDNLNNLSGMNIHSQILIPLKWLVKKEMNTKKKDIKDAHLVKLLRVFNNLNATHKFSVPENC